jgi:hypothetical protein
MVFAVKMAEGAKGPEDCPALAAKNRSKLQEYMKPYQLDG